MLKFSLFSRRMAVGALVTGFLVFGLLNQTAFAQREFGQLVVRVVDPNEAVVPNATVTAKSVATNFTRTAQSDNDGIATITLLPPGEYDVTTTAASFAPLTQRVQVAVNGRVALDARISIQAQATVIDVTTGGITEINTQDQQVSSVVDFQQLQDLPTIDRDPYAFVQLSGNVTSDPGGSTGRGVGFAINGQRAASTNITLDGGENVETFGAGVGQSVPLDSVQEFRVITNNFSAEYGRATGGIVNVSTRSGSNRFNGSVFIYNRNSRFAANDFDSNANGLEKPFSNRNQFGGSVGGRIIRDKLFFFTSIEAIRIRSYGNNSALIPTAELIAASSPRTQAFFASFPVRSGASFGPTYTVGDVRASTPGAFSDPTLANALPAFRTIFYRLPTDVGNGLPGNLLRNSNRIDWNITSRAQFYYRLAYERNDFFPGTNASSPYAGFDTGVTDRNQNHLFNLTYTFSPNFLGNSKFVYNKLVNDQPLGDQPAGPTLYLRSSLGTSLFNEAVALPGYLPFSPGSAIPFEGPQSLGQIYQDFTWNVGKHIVKFGFQYIRLRNNRTFGAYQNAVFGLATTNTVQGLNNLVAGNLRRLQVAIDPQGQVTPGAPVTLPVSPPNFNRDNRANDFAWYVNDNFRLTSRVTLNLGLRWEYYGVQKSADPSLDANFYFGSGANIYEQIRNGAPQIAPDSPVGGLWRPDYKDYAPRVGIAWDVFGDGKTSLRGGYGIAYERNFGNVTFNVIQNPPNYAVVTVNAGDPGFPTIPISTNNYGPLAGSSGTARLPGRLNIRQVNENIRTAYAHLWSASFQHQITNNLVGSVEYSGSAGRKLYDLTNPNRPGYGYLLGDTSDPFGVGGVSSLLNNNYYPLNTRGNLGYSNYRGLTFSLVGNNFSDSGLQFTARYTVSQAKDNLSSTFSDSNGNFNLGLLDPFNPSLDYGYADFDARNRFVGSFNWTVPFAKNYTGFAKSVLDGFTVSGLFTYRSATPFTIFDCTNAFFEVCPRVNPVNGFNIDRNLPDTGNPNTFTFVSLRDPGATIGNFINPITQTSEVGPFPDTMVKRNSFRGFGFWNFDMVLAKNIRFTERYGLQLRAEAYNLFNRANTFLNFGSIDVSSGDSVTASKGGNPRRLQFALRFNF